MLAAEDPGVADALLVLSVPLHPPDKPSISCGPTHFPALRTPALFVQGAKDPFGPIEEIRAALELVPARKELVVLGGLGHDLGRGRFDLEQLPLQLSPAARRPVAGTLRVVRCASRRRDRCGHFDCGRESAEDRFGGLVKFERRGDEQDARRFAADDVTFEVAKAFEITGEQMLAHAQPVVDCLKGQLQIGAGFELDDGKPAFVIDPRGGRLRRARFRCNDPDLAVDWRGRSDASIVGASARTCDSSQPSGFSE